MKSLILLILFAGSTAFARPLRVVALHSVLAECASRIGGDEVRVTCLVPAGSDPHTFNPSPEDAASIVDADLVLVSGFDLEPSFERLVANSGTKAAILRASDLIPNPVHSAEDGGIADPHWWNSIGNIRIVAAAVGAELARLRPADAPAFRRRQSDYEASLASLAAWARSEVNRLPADRRILVTNHDAFAYLARDYGFRIEPLLGLNPAAEPNPRELARLIDFIRAHHVRAVFADNTENPHLLSTMLQESGATLGGVLYADGLGPVGSDASTVEHLFHHNLSTIVDALGGK